MSQKIVMSQLKTQTLAFKSGTLSRSVLFAEADLLDISSEKVNPYSPQNKLLSAKFLVCFNFQSASMPLKVGKNLV